MLSVGGGSLLCVALHLRYTCALHDDGYCTSIAKSFAVCGSAQSRVQDVDAEQGKTHVCSDG